MTLNFVMLYPNQYPWTNYVSKKVKLNKPPLYLKEQDVIIANNRFKPEQEEEEECANYSFLTATPSCQNVGLYADMSRNEQYVNRESRRDSKNTDNNSLYMVALFVILFILLLFLILTTVLYKNSNKNNNTTTNTLPTTPTPAPAPAPAPVPAPTPSLIPTSNL